VQEWGSETGFLIWGRDNDWTLPPNNDSSFSDQSRGSPPSAAPNQKINMGSIFQEFDVENVKKHFSGEPQIAESLSISQLTHSATRDPGCVSGCSLESTSTTATTSNPINGAYSIAVSHISILVSGDTLIPVS